MSRWRDLPSLSSLRAFDATAQHGSFAEAGRALNVTHAAVSQAVRGLEADLGVALVRRNGRTVALTEAGQRLAKSLSEGFGTIASGIEDLRRHEDRRVLRVATTAFIAQALILPRLPEFWAIHPGIEVAMTPGFKTVDLLAEGYDLAIRGWRTEGPGIETEHLAQTRWVVAGAPSLLGDGPVDVRKLPWIVPDEGLLDCLRQAGIELDPLLNVSVGSPYLEISAAVAGLGLTLATEAIIRAELVSGRLREVDVSGFPETHYFATMPSGPRRAATRAFVDWVRTLF
ncbi:LysR substrate-binding domain-containing protein [Tabrizicola sp.]|uniref:LysR substrate-binding domain-containing protein n=1 Tax=Tabrizicola sp. TaxID=2005166 RepID=UPI00262FC475|nr:LysR substrate-binding domain-containing protein [Tabrizicola sp.]MDM7932319.1 LysR substrate-binding domain-containing protein [Tabrizicola sp.]